MNDLSLRFELWHVLVSLFALAVFAFALGRMIYEAGRGRGKLEAAGDSIRRAAQLEGENDELIAENKRIGDLYGNTQGRMGEVVAHLTDALIAAEGGKR